MLNRRPQTYGRGIEEPKAGGVRCTPVVVAISNCIQLAGITNTQIHKYTGSSGHLPVYTTGRGHKYTMRQIHKYTNTPVVVAISNCIQLVGVSSDFRRIFMVTSLVTMNTVYYKN